MRTRLEGGRQCKEERESAASRWGGRESWLECTKGRESEAEFFFFSVLVLFVCFSEAQQQPSPLFPCVSFSTRERASERAPASCEPFLGLERKGATISLLQRRVFFSLPFSRRKENSLFLLFFPTTLTKIFGFLAPPRFNREREGERQARKERFSEKVGGVDITPVFLFFFFFSFFLE
jgi:hypothetical protein